MILPVYLVIGFINIFAKTTNYGIKTDDPKMVDIRVRREIANNQENYPKIIEKHLIREKRQFTYFFNKKTIKITTTTPKYDYFNRNNGKLSWNFVTQNNGMLKTNYYNNNGTDNRYYNFNNGNLTNSLQNTLMPKFNRTGNGSQYPYNAYPYGVFTTPTSYGYNTTNKNPPQFNYQDPTKNSFTGYFQQTNTTNGTKPYAPGYQPIPVFNGTSNVNSTKHWYNNFDNSTITVKNNGTLSTTTEVIQTACIICNISCPANHHRVGYHCVPDDYEY